MKEALCGFMKKGKKNKRVNYFIITTFSFHFTFVN